MKNPININDLLKDDVLSKKILWTIEKWHIDSEQYMSKKRSLFKTWYGKFTNPAVSQSDQIKINMLYQHLKAFISTYYEDWLSVGMVGREFLDDDFAYMLETCAKNDYTIMNKKQKDFFNILNIGFYWVSLVLKNGYDSLNNVIKYDVISPEYWLPDPNGNIMRWFKYHMFEFTISKSEIDNINKEAESNWWEKIYHNIDKYTSVSDWAKQINSWKKEDRALWTSIIDMEEYSGTRVLLEREWRKYIADTFNNRTLLGRWEEIKPVDEVEKKNPSLIPFPIEVYNAFPLENDPCGIWLAELILDFQNAKNRLMNLTLRKEEWNAWFKILLADISKIQDIELLAEKPIDWPIIVPFNGDLWPLNGNVVQPIMDWIQSDQSTINLANILDIEAQSQTWQSNTNRWLPFWPETTLWQAKMQQVNSNLMFSLDSEVISRWEVNFWKNMWLRWLKEFLPQYEKKYARIWNGIASNEVMITGKDLLEHNDPDIVVESKKTTQEKNKQKLDNMMAREAIIMQNPSTPAVSKILFQRDIEKYRWFPREEIYLHFPRSSDENRAIRYIKQINADVVPEAMFYTWMDLWTYYIYLQKCTNNETKKNVLAKIEEMMMKEGLNKQQQPTWGEWGWFEQLTNSMSSQLTSNVAQQSGQVNNYPTKADVLNP